MGLPVAAPVNTDLVARETRVAINNSLRETGESELF